MFVDRGIATQLITIFEQDLKFAQPDDDHGLRRGLSRVFYLPLLPLRDQL